jgi:hypothetical protein
MVCRVNTLMRWIIDKLIIYNMIFDAPAKNRRDQKI